MTSQPCDHPRPYVSSSVHLGDESDKLQPYGFKISLSSRWSLAALDWPAFWLATRSFIYPHVGEAGYNYFICFLTFRRLCPFYSGKWGEAVEKKCTLLNVVVTQWPLKSSGHRSRWLCQPCNLSRACSWNLPLGQVKLDKLEVEAPKQRKSNPNWALKRTTWLINLLV